jgi:hypothetical protein
MVDLRLQCKNAAALDTANVAVMAVNEPPIDLCSQRWRLGKEWAKLRLRRAKLRLWRDI